MNTNMDRFKSATGMSDTSNQGTTMNPATSAGSEHPSRDGQSSINPMSSKTASSSGVHHTEDKGMMDRGMESMENKMGMGSSTDTDQMRGINERIGDEARGMFEKTMGKDMPDQFSK